MLLFSFGNGCFPVANGCFRVIMVVVPPTMVACTYDLLEMAVLVLC